MDGKTIEFLYNIGLINLSNIILFIVFGFFGKQLILYFFSETIELKKTELSKELENHKKELNTQTESYKTDLSKILESHKSELNLFNLKNSRIYERRLEIIAELYKKIVLVERYMREMTVLFKEVSPDEEVRKKEENETITKAANSYNDFVSYFSENEIFLSNTIIETLESLRRTFFDIFYDYTLYDRLGIDDSFGGKWKSKEKAWEQVKNTIPNILSNLKEEFRKLLNVSEN